MKRSMRLAGIVTLIWAISSNGCSPVSDTSRNADIDAEALYTPGTSRDDLETRFGPGSFYWIYDLIPKDEFAAATIKAMVSIRKPRPAAYEVFLRRNTGPGGAYSRDYVFYNDRAQVLYAARRISN
ncbi:MAG: hypothetical protein JWN40_4453 [Phycisphaerales bacterium]|nr:hypothetical protein [Phycisphaerales bacterium]